MAAQIARQASLVKLKDVYDSHEDNFTVVRAWRMRCVCVSV